MKNIQRIAALVLCLLLALSAAACGREPETVAVTEPPEQAAAPEVATPSREAQLQLLEDNRALWAFTEPYDSPWFYTFTDLDHNGLLEVLAATTQGSGVFTYARFYEVLPDGTGLRNCCHENEAVEGPDDWPEIVRDSLPCYYDREADRYYYPCEGVTRSGAAWHYSTWYALCLKDGVAEWELLAGKTVDETGEAPVISCRDAQGQEITEADYDSAVQRRFAGLEESTLTLEWTQVENPLEPAEPAIAEAGAGAPVVTKSPSSEAVAIGGRTWFIAHASGAESLSWQLVAPDGTVYGLDEAMQANPGLSLEALEGDTLAVGDVPVSVNGWAVQARFEGPGGSAVSEAAQLFVGDFLSAYGEVIARYKTAYEGGNNTGEYARGHELSEMIAYSNGLGYAFKDLDKDGVPELILAGMGTQDAAENLVYDLYTLENGVPRRLAVSQARARYYLRSDSSLYCEGSSGAAYSSCTVQRLTNGALEDVELIFTYAEDPAGDAGYFYQQGHSEALPSDKSVRITDEDYLQKQTQLQSTIDLPAMTRLY